MRFGALIALACLLWAPAAAAGDVVELTPFAGIQFGGSVESNVHGRPFTLGAGFTWGATLDVPVTEGWRVELLYARQDTELSSRGLPERVGLGIERYLVGIQEEKGPERTKFFGVFLLGATRFVPSLSGYSPDLRFTAGLSLGIRHAVTRRLGLRAEARAFFVNRNSGAGLVCSGGCLFAFNANGLWQGDVSAGIALRL